MWKTTNSPLETQPDLQIVGSTVLFGSQGNEDNLDLIDILNRVEDSVFSKDPYPFFNSIDYYIDLIE